MNQNSECRICFEKEEIDNKFISPCLCNGTSKYVHMECLETWRNINKNGPGFNKCMECRYRYKFKYKFPKENNIYYDVTYRKILYFLYFFPLFISILLNLSNTRGQLLFLLDFGQTKKTKAICWQQYNNSRYCYSTSLYGALQNTDYFSYTIFNTSVLMSYQLILSTVFYIYKNKTTIKRYNEFNKINRKAFTAWIFNMLKFFLIYYTCVFLIHEPIILLGYPFVYVIFEPIVLLKFVETHGDSIRELNASNPCEILDYDPNLQDDYFGEEIDYDEILSSENDDIIEEDSEEENRENITIEIA